MLWEADSDRFKAWAKAGEAWTQRLCTLVPWRGKEREVFRVLTGGTDNHIVVIDLRISELPIRTPKLH
ncbi:MAG: hypothetical protein ACKESB_00175 [Candidatus Hodgkinia cicadicola]